MSNNVDERFDLAENSVEKVMDLMKDMKEIGVYDNEEYKAAAILLLSLSRAMKVLDPKRADAYMRDALDKAMSEAHTQGIDLGATQFGQNFGQYL